MMGTHRKIWSDGSMAVWLFTLVAALIAHVAFFFLFGPEKETVKPATVSGGRIIMLPLAAEDAFPDRDRVLEWMRKNPPDAFIKPDAKIGYSALIANARKHFDIANVAFVPAERPHFANSVIAAPGPTRNAALRDYWIDVASRHAADLPLARQAGTVAAPPPYPRWTNAMEAPLAIALDRAIALDDLPEKPTELRVEDRGADHFPRVRVARSCGKPLLDETAVRAFLKTAAVTYPSPVSDEDLLTVEWGPSKTNRTAL